MFAESLLALLGILTLHSSVHPTPPVLALNELPIAKYVTGPNSGPTKKSLDSLGVDVTAKAAAVVDVASGQVLFEKDGETPYPIASLTKLMTAMTFLDTKPNLDEEV